MLELILQRGGKKLLRWPIDEGSITVGRSSDNTVVLLDPEISRHHCRLEWKEGVLVVTDRSSNGTLVNGELRREAVIAAGDRMAVGPWTLLIEAAPEAVPMRTLASAPEATRIIHYDETSRRLTTEAIEFVITSPDQAVLRRTISADEITIGHHAACTIAVADPFISRRHCRIVNRDGKLLLADLGSTNGTRFDGARVERTALPTSGAFEIGRSTVAWRVVREARRIAPSAEARLGSLIGPSAPMRELFALILKVAPSEATVCITGESGTGKELVARELHTLSARRGGPFVAINCGALPASLIEGQLFGHERGAFTGALERLPGLFEQAKGGTVFLDEIGEMPPELQTRLLRVLEERKVRRIGGEALISIDMRIICATNRDLRALVKEGRFREDLFFRLYVVPIALPPLRERPEDVRALAHHFVRALARPGGPNFLTDAAAELLVRHRWPGNVRELRNVIERAMLLSNGESIDAADIRIEEIAAPGSGGSALRAREREVVAAALAACNGNVSRASRKLGIARTTLQKKIRRYALPRADAPDAEDAQPDPAL